MTALNESHGLISWTRVIQFAIHSRVQIKLPLLCYRGPVRTLGAVGHYSSIPRMLASWTSSQLKFN